MAVLPSNATEVSPSAIASPSLMVTPPRSTPSVLDVSVNFALLSSAMVSPPRASLLMVMVSSASLSSTVTVEPSAETTYSPVVVCVSSTILPSVTLNTNVLSTMS